ncbi:Trm112p family domain-containing protein [Cardiosporidium cionae]|uniref:Trm112p family domain-containing protein n=1 Tax=Cardiosporidium cionae TaxID=476202 RepID=A0ABQ7J6T8_9APIC|nr:Trm112p family domain-containing protein [Cardiosporidium cionae]|eukprot:KAF8819690.1 Trm112p family domain-containing protein [Cardiosporidium cionae]
MSDILLILVNIFVITCSNRQHCLGGFPLTVRLAEDIEKPTNKVEMDFNRDLIQNLLNKLDWESLVNTATSLGISLPPSYIESDKEDDMFLRAIHEVVLEFHILEGSLVCPTCDRVYPISKGIPNMLLHEDEV